jgi:hypothetical protein
MAGDAIEHSKMLARFSYERPRKDHDLSIVVIDESGTEVHREQMYANLRHPELGLGKIG